MITQERQKHQPKPMIKFVIDRYEGFDNDPAINSYIDLDERVVQDFEMSNVEDAKTIIFYLVEKFNLDILNYQKW